MITQITRAGNPFPAHGTSRDRNGVIHFDDLPGSLPAMLHGWVERSPDAEAVAELDGDRLSYRQLWDRAGRVAGGLRARGVTGGSRVAGGCADRARIMRKSYQSHSQDHPGAAQNLFDLPLG